MKDEEKGTYSGTGTLQQGAGGEAVRLKREQKVRDPRRGSPVKTHTHTHTSERVVNVLYDLIFKSILSRYTPNMQTG